MTYLKGICDIVGYLDDIDGAFGYIWSACGIISSYLWGIGRDVVRVMIWRELAVVT